MKKILQILFFFMCNYNSRNFYVYTLKQVLITKLIAYFNKNFLVI